MLTKLSAQENILYNLELEAKKLIEDKLNVFFDSCMEGLVEYSCMLVNNCEYYNRDSFEMMVLSSKKINELVKNIIIEINDNIIRNNYEKLSLSIFTNNIVWSPVLDCSVKQFNLSLKITNHCEDIINKTISKLLNKNPYNHFMLDVLKSKNIGAFILGKNNYINMQIKYQKEIYKQIEGILLNTKYIIRNHLINQLIITIKMNDFIIDEQFMITA